MILDIYTHILPDAFFREMSRASPKLENHASLAVDAAGRLWIAWEAGPEKWASDSAEGGLRPDRNIEIACWKDGKLYRASEAEAALRKLGGKGGLHAPAIAFNAGAMIFFAAM